MPRAPDQCFARAALAALVLCLPPACMAPPPPANAPIAHDFLTTARHWRSIHGLATARDLVSSTLPALDADGGALERRVLAANAHKDLTPPNSLAALPPQQRARTGIFLVLGYHTKSRRSEPVIRHVAEHLSEHGWHAVLVPIPEHGSPAEDAAAINDCLRRELPHLDHAILIGFSKGTLDWLHWAATHAADLPSDDRRKVSLFISFAGAVRGAAVADWLTRGTDPAALLLRANIRSQGKRALTAASDTARDPWLAPSPPRLREYFPNLRAVQVVAIPEDPHGHTRADPRFRLLGKCATRRWNWLGPVDGLVESAGQVLPACSGVPQHIVRVFGSHAVLDGTYANGGMVSPIYRAGGPDYTQGGTEMLRDMLSAIPSSWLKQAP